jgi:predicted HicB family RNase H-like nuclease
MSMILTSKFLEECETSMMFPYEDYSGHLKLRIGI